MDSLQANLAGAQDAQIARVVALVDALPQRGAADDLIAPLRPRLQQSRPRRACGLLRLLFTPLDPLIVPAERWQPGALLIPRPVLAPIGAAIRAAMRDPAAIEAQALAIDAADHPAIIRIGQAAWPMAAAACDTKLPAIAWPDMAASAQAQAGLVARIGAILHAASEIEVVVGESGDGQDAAMRSVLGRAAARGPAGFAAVVTLLLLRQAPGARVVACAADIAGSAEYRAATDAAVDTTLDCMAALLDSPAELPRLAATLDGLAPGSTAKPDQARRIASIRGQAGDACRRAVQHTVTEGILRRLHAMPSDPADADIAGLEASARDLRRIEASGRRFGAEGSEALLKSCRDVFRSDRLTPLSLPDRVRMLEILGAPDEAMELLAAG